VVNTPCGDVERRLVPELFTDFFWSALGVYNRFKMFGFPFSGGWAEQPAHIVDVIEAFESAARAIDRERAEKWRSQNNSKSR
jgi:hypothetical protein